MIKPLIPNHGQAIHTMDNVDNRARVVERELKIPRLEFVPYAGLKKWNYQKNESFFIYIYLSLQTKKSTSQKGSWYVKTKGMFANQQFEPRYDDDPDEQSL